MLQKIGPSRMWIAIGLIIGWGVVSLAAIGAGVVVANFVGGALEAEGISASAANVAAIATAFGTVTGIVTTVTTAAMLALQNVVRPDNEDALPKDDA